MFDLFLIYALFLVVSFLAGVAVPYRLVGRVLAVTFTLAVLVTVGGAAYLWMRDLDWGDSASELGYAVAAFFLANVLFSVVGVGIGQALRWFCRALYRAIRGEG